ncbi:hypothetical protein A3D77_04335 [Candidatus Gottesmanbacteria bacterium RIFCSPHIGHO2_02_FULL_39_11]|uniref:Beta-xylosidase C-terminal Concanavalin A-like domain-containing protein n=1 Tax=Candidatus Gottesmanbacteria bacterium RIFCSPHIGHO2_02_FULL_39_11 TaxID=1798382 RepID=A0A1F5ZKC6_9BACT|nr:MAG: hypothetical protein A3D77_04335 [Candidatus Gottesmanbacteria bacterium RIFCSPHIGHO2_02_FULL_39_11]
MIIKLKKIGFDSNKKNNGTEELMDSIAENKKKVISVGIILATVIAGIFLLMAKKSTLFSRKDYAGTPLSSVQLKFTEKNYKLDHSSYDAGAVIKIAYFEKNENWQGQHDFDSDIAIEGESSLLLESRDNQKAESYLEEKFNLSSYEIFKLAVYLETDPSDLESVRLYFANKDKTAYFVYPITNLVKGWNYLKIPKMKFSSVNASKESIAKSKPINNEATSGSSPKDGSLLNWDKVERVGLEVTSRSNVTSTVNFDDLRGLSSEDYLDGWLTTGPLFLDLIKSPEDNVTLQGKNIGASVALIKKLAGVSNFTFKAKLVPMKVNARSGFFIRGNYKTSQGYFFMIDGVGGNRWQILKNGLVDEKDAQTILKNGVINNFAVDDNQPLWLKVEARGDNMKFYLSTDGKSYTKLGEINDSEFKQGGVGIAVYDSGVTLFDDFEFQQ